MSHLSRDELLAVVEGGATDAHLAGCASCRAEVEALGAVLREVASMPVPEPSPLFWEHFSARVRETCSREASASREWLRPWRLVVPVVAAVVLLVVAGWFLVSRPVARLPVPPTTAATVVPSGSRETTLGTANQKVDGNTEKVDGYTDDSLAADESWRAFAAVASEADPAGTAFGAPAPGVADGVVLQMSDKERGELIRLLEDELARGSAHSRG